MRRRARMTRIPQTNEKKILRCLVRFCFLKAVGQRRSSVMCDLHEHRPEDDYYEIICCYMTEQQCNLADNQKASGVTMGFNNWTANVSCISIQLCKVSYCFQPLFKIIYDKCVHIRAEEESFCRYTEKISQIFISCCQVWRFEHQPTPRDSWFGKLKATRASWRRDIQEQMFSQNKK